MTDTSFDQHPPTFRITFNTADLLDRHLLDDHAVDAGSDDLETLERRHADDHAVHDRFVTPHRHEWPDGNVKPPIHGPSVSTVHIAATARRIADHVLAQVSMECRGNADDWLGQPSTPEDRAILVRYVSNILRREL